MTEVLHSEKILYLAMELSNKTWKLAFSDGSKVRQVNVPAGNVERLRAQVVMAKQKLGLAPECEVHSCFEAGRDGFWIHRMLETLGIQNLVVDSASIEVNRRQRRAKTDRLDAEKLVRMLMRYLLYGEKKTWSVVRVPSEAQEDERRRHRERERLVHEHSAHAARIRSLLCLNGSRLRRMSAAAVRAARDWSGRPLPESTAAELRRELDRLAVLDGQLAELEAAQAQRLKAPQTAVECRAQRLNGLRAIGPVTATTLSEEGLGWRNFRNRRQVGAWGGLTGTPYDSGQSTREQGISKAGNRRVRTLMVELSWGWLRYQPRSNLSLWYQQRFGQGNKRMRRVGIVALARKLLVALWKYLEHDELPDGAVLRCA